MEYHEEMIVIDKKIYFLSEANALTISNNIRNGYKTPDNLIVKNAQGEDESIPYEKLVTHAQEKYCEHFF